MSIKTIYLCGPINGRSDANCKNWRKEFKKMASFQYIDPMRRDYRGRESHSFHEIVLLDKLDIQQCDALVVMYDEPSVGTSMEICYAHSIGKPIVLIDQADGPLSPWMLYHCTAVVGNLGGAMAKLREWFIC